MDDIKLDARNRAWRTFAVGLGTDVLAAVFIALAPFILSDGFRWDGGWWVMLALLTVRTVIQSAFSYALRLFVPPRV